MNASELQQLVEQGEGQQLEFKRSLAELETAARTTAGIIGAEGFGVSRFRYHRSFFEMAVLQRELLSKKAFAWRKIGVVFIRKSTYLTKKTRKTRRQRR